MATLGGKSCILEEKMNDMEQGIPDVLRNSSNEVVLEFIKDASAHSDLAEVLEEAVAPLGDVQTFCPDPLRYRYVLVFTKKIIFGFAMGSNMIAFRLNPLLKGRALKTGGTDLSEAGPDWVSFAPFRDDWPEIDFKF